MPQLVTLKKLKLNGSIRPKRPFRTNTQKRCPFHYWGLECKSSKSNLPGVTGKFGPGVQNEAGQRLIDFCQENVLFIAKHPLPITQEKTTHGYYQMVNTEIRLINILCSKRWRCSTQSAKIRPGADCGLDHELLIEKLDLH